MTQDLRAMLAQAADAESLRFDSEHAGDEVTLYHRAITPRRAARRLAQVGGTAAAVALAVWGAFAVVPGHDRMAPVASAEPTASAETDSTTVPDLASRTWETPRLAVEPDARASTLANSVGDSLAPECAVLDDFATLAAQPEAGGAARAHGTAALPGDDAPAVGVYTRTFSNAGAAAAFMDHVADAANACVDAARGGEAEVSDLAIGSIPGSGVQVEIGTDEVGRVAQESQTWSAWWHREGAEVIATISEPGADPSVPPKVITVWFSPSV